MIFLSSLLHVVYTYKQYVFFILFLLFPFGSLHPQTLIPTDVRIGRYVCLHHSRSSIIYQHNNKATQTTRRDCRVLAMSIVLLYMYSKWSSIEVPSSSCHILTVYIPMIHCRRAYNIKQSAYTYRYTC